MSKKLKTEKFDLNLEDLIIVKISQKEAVLDVNRKGCELLETVKGEVLGKNWFDVFVPESSRDSQRLSFHQLLNETSSKGLSEDHILTKSGKDLIVSWHMLPFKNEKSAVAGALLSGREITERRKAQERYIVLASFPAFNPNPIIELDFDGNITYTNPATKKVFLGIEKKGLKQPFFADWEKIVAGFSGKLSTEYAYVREIKLDGHWYLQQFSFIPIGPKIRVYSVNIDEKKKIEEALMESEKKFRSLFENMINGYAYCKMLFNEKGAPEDYVYLEVNDAFERITGLKRENVLGRKATQAIPGVKKTNSELFEIYGRVAKTGKPERFEVFFKPLDVWLDISVYGPKPEHFVAIYENISERKRLEQELNSYNQRLAEVVAQRTAEYALSNKRLTKEIMDRKKSEEGLLLRAMILDNLNQAIVMTNQNGGFVYTNHAACELFGYTCEEFLSLNFMDLLGLEGAKQKALTDKLLKTKQAELDVVGTRKDRSGLRLHLHLSLVKTVHGEFIVSVIDKTEG